ncbi:hypothetical protein [Haloarchaeobius litoreus]|uniref:Uncharacterized protein n=1 Tax=Haloarchaeobius litoreus TaxID=755306 RepID=A0ABD6DP06_9EURY|nr:hypothetical protein [Haloarchaeobius litoreus]
MTDLEQEWKDAAPHPHPETDLEYECLSISVVKAEQYERLLLLPEDEDMLHDDAFMVVGEDDLVDLSDMA